MKEKMNGTEGGLESKMRKGEIEREREYEREKIGN